MENFTSRLELLFDVLKCSIEQSIFYPTLFPKYSQIRWLFHKNIWRGDFLKNNNLMCGNKIKNYDKFENDILRIYD